MKTNKSNKNDGRLCALLKEWKPRASLPLRFQEQVWRRIEQAQTAPTSSGSYATVFVSWITELVMPPASATVYLAVLLLFGAGMGWSVARHQTVRVTGELSARYARAIDPYQAMP